MPKKPQRKIVGSRLGALKAERGIKDLPLSQAIGVSPSQIKRWKTNETAAMPDAVHALATFFGVSEAFLYGFDAKDVRERLATELERALGEAEADIVRALGALDERGRLRLSGRVIEWIEREIAAPMPDRKTSVSMITRGGDGESAVAQPRKAAQSGPGSHRPVKP